MRRLEDQIQAGIVRYLRAVLPDHMVAHVPNGGRRDKIEAARLKAAGVLAGFPDIIILAPGGRAYLMEVKTDKGRLSKAQEEFAEWCDEATVYRSTVRSIDDARQAVYAWGLRSRDAA